jgi:hypothetical protein
MPMRHAIAITLRSLRFSADIDAATFSPLRCRRHFHIIATTPLSISPAISLPILILTIILPPLIRRRQSAASGHFRQMPTLIAPDAAFAAASHFRQRI